jgi:hypothetical protein
MPELKRFERTKSMILYLPPNGTAGLDLPMVMGLSRSPLPPAITMAIVFRVILAVAYMKYLLEVIFSSIEQFPLIRKCAHASRNIYLT